MTFVRSLFLQLSEWEKHRHSAAKRGAQAYKEVVRLFRNETKEWYHVRVNGEEIVCTGGHPFYVANLDKFIPARELKVGEGRLLSSGVYVTIEAIQVVL